MKHKIIIALAIILILGMAIFILIQNKDIKKYENGFIIKGTYTPSLDTQTDYLVFSESNTFYSYQQFGKVLKGTYTKTENPNVFILRMDNSLKGYIFLSKDSLTYVENEQTIGYEKLSTGEIYNNVHEPQ